MNDESENPNPLGGNSLNPYLFCFPQNYADLMKRGLKIILLPHDTNPNYICLYPYRENHLVIVAKTLSGARKADDNTSLFSLGAYNSNRLSGRTYVQDYLLPGGNRIYLQFVTTPDATCVGSTKTQSLWEHVPGQLKNLIISHPASQITKQIICNLVKAIPPDFNTTEEWETYLQEIRVPIYDHVVYVKTPTTPQKVVDRCLDTAVKDDEISDGTTMAVKIEVTRRVSGNVYFSRDDVYETEVELPVSTVAGGKVAEYLRGIPARKYRLKKTGEPQYGVRYDTLAEFDFSGALLRAPVDGNLDSLLAYVTELYPNYMANHATS
jgi:hypothetical protein